MINQEDMQATYNVEYPIKILFDHIETGQDFAVAGNLPFSGWQLADIGVAKILATQEYTHLYCMWKIIGADDHTWLKFKAYFQEACMDREEIE